MAGPALLLVAVLLFAPVEATFAWGDIAHERICALAWGLVADSTRDRLRQAFESAENAAAGDSPGIGAEQRPPGLPLDCNWMDLPSARQRFGDHHVNIDPAAHRFDRKRDCPGERCAVDVLERQFALLTGERRNVRYADAAASAYLVIGHLVADLHQPLHAGFASDRGGNDLEVSWDEGGGRREWSLHLYWDVVVPETVVHDVVAESPELRWIFAFERTRSDEADLRTMIESWVTESHLLARCCAYRDPWTAQRLLDGSVISPGYAASARGIVTARLLTAAARLALVLDRVASESSGVTCRSRGSPAR